ncbi:MAG: ABC transporter permease [Alphaproteobacteria bacterium]|nr:ABC transporter permease [Alphaproteobacteria bacterium]
MSVALQDPPEIEDAPRVAEAAPSPGRVQYRFLGFKITPVAHRRLGAFVANRRGFWSLWIFLALFVLSLFAELIANDRPILVQYDGAFYFPVVQTIPETAFGGFFETEAEYKDPEVQELILEKGWMLWPLVPYSYRNQVLDLPGPAPTAPDSKHWLGTDDQARDVLARMIYGFRISVLFGLALVFFTGVIGVAVGLAQGFFGGLTDLLGQRVIEVWVSLPTLYLLIILASIVQPNFWWLLGIMVAFGWTGFVGPVRAETLRARNLDFVRASRALGVSNGVIMLRHILPNAMVATLTFMPFVLSGAVVSLASLDFLGFGLPPGSPSLGELIKQGKNNLQAPWLGLTAFFTVGVMMTLLIFIGEAVRDAFDPRKSLG